MFKDHFAYEEDDLFFNWLPNFNECTAHAHTSDSSLRDLICILKGRALHFCDSIAVQNTSVMNIYVTYRPHKYSKKMFNIHDL
jgi:hypothetical protein